jgi:hypothetical protein
MKVQRSICCPNCKASFAGEHIEYAQHTTCPRCAAIFGVALKYILFESEAEKESFLKAVDDELTELIAPVVESFKKELQAELHEKQSELRQAADHILLELFDHKVPELLDIVPVVCMKHVEMAEDVIIDETVVPRSKPSSREYCQSVFMECITESVLAILDDGLRRGLEQLEGLLFFDIPQATIDFQTCKIPGIGSFVVTPYGSATTLAAMNYEVLMATIPENTHADEHVQQLLESVWYLVLGQADFFDRTLESFFAAIDRKNSQANRSIILTSIIMAEHQLRFIVAHELGHLLAVHFDIPEYQLSKVLGKERVRTPDGELYHFIHPAVPLSEIPPELRERLQSQDRTTTVTRGQALELQADRIACDLCLDKKRYVVEKLERYIARCRQPDLARTMFFEHLFSSQFETLFANSVHLLMTYFILRGLAYDRYLGIQHVKKHSYTVPEAIESHPWPELRLNYLQDFFREKRLDVTFSECIIPLTDRGTFWKLNQRLVEKLWQDL